MVFWKRNVFRHMKGFDPGKLERCNHTIQMKNDSQKQKQIESGSVNLDFYEAWKVAEEEEQNKKKKRKTHKKRKSTPDSADRSRSCPRRRSPIEVSTDPYLLECLGEFC